MKPELFDSELKIMKTLWKHGDCTPGQMAKLLKDEIGWNRNTAYTVIKKCIEKGAVIRLEPNLLCRAAVTRQEIKAPLPGSHKRESALHKRQPCRPGTTFPVHIPHR